MWVRGGGPYSGTGLSRLYLGKGRAEVSSDTISTQGFHHTRATAGTLGWYPEDIHLTVLKDKESL